MTGSLNRVRDAITWRSPASLSADTCARRMNRGEAVGAAPGSELRCARLDPWTRARTASQT